MLRHRLPWQKPYRGTLLNKSHPLARGLVFALLFNEHGGNYYNNHGSIPVTNDNIMSVDWHPVGLDIDYSERLQFSASSMVFTQEITIVTEVILQDISTKNITAFFKGTFDGDADVSFFGLRENHETLAGKWGLYSTGSGVDAWANSLLATGDKTKLAVARKGASCRFFRDGVFENDSSAHGSNNFGDTGSKVILGEDWTSSGGNWLMKYLYVWDRQLSDADVLWLHREPYAMFYPLNHARLVDPGIEDYYDEDQWVSFRVYQSDI